MQIEGNIDIILPLYFTSCHDGPNVDRGHDDHMMVVLLVVVVLLVMVVILLLVVLLVLVTLLVLVLLLVLIIYSIMSTPFLLKERACPMLTHGRLARVLVFVLVVIPFSMSTPFSPTRVRFPCLG